MIVKKSGITIDIPRFGDLHIKTIVSDYTGTHSRGGQLVSGSRQRLIRLAKLVDIVILTSDSFGTAKEQLRGVPHQFERLQANKPADVQKKKLVERYDPRHVAAFGNGNNDRLMLKSVRKAGGLAIAVDNGEGCAIDAIMSAHLFIVGSANALDLLLQPTRFKATLRF
jgi:soluble P-type ATPase